MKGCRILSLCFVSSSTVSGSILRFWYLQSVLSYAEGEKRNAPESPATVNNDVVHYFCEIGFWLDVLCTFCPTSSRRRGQEVGGPLQG